MNISDLLNRLKKTKDDVVSGIRSELVKPRASLANNQTLQKAVYYTPDVGRNISDFFRGTNNPVQSAQSIQGLANNIRNPVARSAAQVASYPVLQGSRVVQGARDIGANYPTALMNLGNNQRFDESFNKILGGLGEASTGAFNLTPMGYKFNAAFSGGTGAIGALARKKNPIAGAISSFTNEKTPSQVIAPKLAEEHPLAAGVFDIAAGFLADRGLSKTTDTLKFVKKVRSIDPKSYVRVDPKIRPGWSIPVKELVPTAQGKYTGGVIREEEQLVRKFLRNNPEYAFLSEQLNKPVGKLEPGFLNLGEFIPKDANGKSLKQPNMPEQNPSLPKPVSSNLPQEMKTNPSGERPLQTGQKIELTTNQEPSVRSYKPIVNPEDPYFNVNKLNVPKKAKEVVKKEIEGLQTEVKKVTGEVLSNKEVVAKAEKTAKIVEKVVGRDQTEAEIANNLRLRQKLAEMARTGRADEDFIKTFIQAKSYATDKARQLQALSIDAQPKDFVDMNAIMEAVYKVNQNADEIAAAAKGVDFNDVAQATAFYRKFVKPKASEWVDLLRYNSMLSSPKTHINNIFSNAQGTGLIAPIEKTITGGVDFLGSKLLNKPRRYFAGEGVEYAKGYYSNLGEAAHKFAQVMRGTKLSDFEEVGRIPLAAKGKLKTVENVLSYPSKLLQAADEFFQTATEAGSTSALKYKESKGIKVGDIKEAAFLEGRKRLFNAKPGLSEEGSVLKAMEFLPGLVAQAKNSNNPIISNIAKFTFPFTRVPTNILKQSVEYSPLGLATVPGAKNAPEQIAKAIMGTSVALGTAMLFSSDRMTWAEPTDNKKRNAFRAAGLQPYSVKIGNKWVNYSKLHPAIAFNMALAAAWKDANDNKKLNDGQLDTIANTMAKWLNFYADQSYVKNLGDFVAAAKGDTYAVSRYIANSTSQVIPFKSLLNWVNNIFDPYQRQADPDGSLLDKQFQQIMTQIPGLSQMVPTRKDEMGNPIMKQNRLLNAVSPLNVTSENNAAKGQYQSMVEKTKQTRLESQVTDLLKQGKEADVVQTGANGVKYARAGNKYIFINSKGEKESIDMSPIEAPKLTGEYVLDKELLSDYSSSITSRINDVVKLNQLGLMTAEQARNEIVKLQSIKAEVKNITAKPKKPKKLNFKVKTPKVASNLVKISSVKRPELIAPKVTPLKVKQIENYKPAKIKVRKLVAKIN